MCIGIVDVVKVICSVYYGTCTYIATIIVDEDVLHDGEEPGLQVS